MAIAAASLAGGIALWVVSMIFYLGCLTAAEVVRLEWRQYQRKRQYRRIATAEIGRIHDEATASVERIGAAFMVAQQLVRHHER